jgi:hypothetical protein
MSTIEVVPAAGLSSFLAFCRLPRVLYTSKPGFAPPLDVLRWDLLAARFNPHFKLVESERWLARKDGRLAGRILAQIYGDGFVPNGASRAQFGCLDAIDDDEVVAALTRTAEAWLLERGAELVHGPFSPSINSEVGMLVEGFESTPMIFMPWHPQYLSRALEKQGYAKARDLLSFRYEVSPADRRQKPGVVSRPEWRERLKIRHLDLAHLDKEAEIMMDIFNDAWRDNWGYVPFTIEEFLSTAEGLKYVMPREGGFMIELDGRPQAFAVILPNLYEIMSDLGGRLFPLGLPRLLWRIKTHKYKTARVALFGLRRALHRSASGGAVVLAFMEEARRRSSSAATVDQIEFGWVLENNLAMRRPIELSGARIDKVHRIYEKRLGIRAGGPS